MHAFETHHHLAAIEAASQPLPAEQEDAREAAAELCGALSDRLEIDEVRLVGSLSRDTALAPIKDIDLICVLGVEQLTEPHAETKRAVMEAVSGLPEVADVRSGDAVVLAEFADRAYAVDIVPLIQTEHGLVLRRKEEPKVVLHNPSAQHAVAEQADRVSEGHYRPLVRLVKLWNRRNGRPMLRSYIAESLVWHAQAAGSDYAESFGMVLEYASRALSRPFLGDPGNPHDNVLGGITEAQRRESREYIDRHRSMIERALAAGDNADHEEAIRLWNRVFGKTA